MSKPKLLWATLVLLSLVFLTILLYKQVYVYLFGAYPFVRMNNLQYSNDTIISFKNGRLYADYGKLLNLSYQKVPVLTPNYTYRFEVKGSSGTYFVAHINSAGFRGKDYTLVKPNNTIRIFLLGDSFTYGYGLDDNATLAYFLERMLTNLSNQRVYEVFNLGVPGYDTKDEIDVFFTKWINYSPDVVILFYVPNDHIPSNVERNVRFLLRERFNLTQEEIDDVMIKQFLTQYNNYLLSRYSVNETLYRNVFPHIERLTNYTKVHNITFILFIFPQALKFEQVIIDYCKKHQLICINSKDFGYTYKSPWVLNKYDSHPSAYANKRVAEYLAEFLKERNLLHPMQLIE